MAFDERPASAPTPHRAWLLALPVLVGLIWLGVLAVHAPHGLSQTLKELRGEPPADAGSNPAMADALDIRRGLILHPGERLSPAQSRRLVRIIGAPVNEQSQSEALDVLGLAQRAHALSPSQSQAAQAATLSVLQTSPGPMVRLESARFLGHIGGAASVPALTVLLDDPDPKVQAAARQALTRRQK